MPKADIARSFWFTADRGWKALDSTRNTLDRAKYTLDTAKHTLKRRKFFFCAPFANLQTICSLYFGAHTTWKVPVFEICTS